MNFAIAVHACTILASITIAHASPWLQMVWWEHTAMLLVAAFALHQAHVAGHGLGAYWKRLGYWWFRSHAVGHHAVCYPAVNFLRHSYKVNPFGWDGWTDLLAYGSFVILSLLMTYRICAFRWTSVKWVYLLFELIVLLLVENYLHGHIHTSPSRLDRYVRASWLERYRWFLHLRYAHFLHHSIAPNRNFAVAALWIDLVLCTYREPDPIDMQYLIASRLRFS